jgi:hypothetical protein
MKTSPRSTSSSTPPRATPNEHRGKAPAPPSKINFRKKFEALNRVRLTDSEIAPLLDDLTGPLMAKIKAIADQSRTLATLRDTLLPKLLSGELSVNH